MTKKSDKLEEAPPQAETGTTEILSKAPPISEWEQLVRAWADKTNIYPVAQRLRDELAREGVTSVEMVATAPIKLIAHAARAAIQADAQALQAAAMKITGGKS